MASRKRGAVEIRYDGSTETKEIKKRPREDAPPPMTSIESSTPERLQIKLTGIDRSVANALRRLAMAEVATMAIEDVYIRSNTSLLHDATLSLQLGMVPLVSTAVDQYKYQHECGCNAVCKHCGVTFHLNVKNTGTTVRAVTTRDLLPADDTCLILPAHTSYEAADDEQSVTFAQLAPGEEISLRAIARKGVGKTHAKWSSHVSVAFKSPAVVRVRSDLLARMSVADLESIVYACHDGVLAMNKDRTSIETTEDAMNSRKCTYCQKCMETTRGLGQPDAVDVSETPQTWIFTVGTTGSLPPLYLFAAAIKQFHSRLERVRGLLLATSIGASGRLR